VKKEGSLFTLSNVHRQYLACRRHKRNTANALRFEAAQEMKLLALRDALVARSYEPGRSVCFFVKRPKLREVFAADFRDPVGHHVLVDHLESIWEPVFIHDSYACRKGKGVHAAVSRLQQFMRQATANGTRPAFTLQLDVRNYFMSIDKQRLFEMLAARLRPQVLADAQALWLARTLVFHDCTRTPVLKGDPRLLEQLPAHKTLFHAPPGKGLPIGNLNSQFFANVYLNALDQFVKHELKCGAYLRYCDDFVLVAQTAEQLAAWKLWIEAFLADRLLLQLNPARERLRPVSDGVDFLGYIVRPTHLRVARIWAANPWLDAFLVLDRDALRLRRRDQPPADARTVQAQYRHWQREFAGDVVLTQVGAFVEKLQWPPRRLPRAVAAAPPGGLRRMRPTRRGALCGFPIEQLPARVASITAAGGQVTFIGQAGETGHGLMQRLPLWRRLAPS
jgi:hypothetical protein